MDYGRRAVGAITHQAAAALWPATSKASFISSFRDVAGARYTAANIIIYVVTDLLLILGLDAISGESSSYLR
jgi:hypothetical protein